MSDIFVSYVEEDKETAAQIAEMLEGAGYTTWSYERQGLPGHDFISQITHEIAAAKAIVLLISVQALSSQHVETELFQAYSNKRLVIPLLLGIKYDEVKKRRPNWATMLGAAAAMDIDPDTVAKVKPRIIKSLEKKGIYPSNGKEPKLTEELRTDRRHLQSSRPDRRDSKRRKSLIIIGAALALAVLSIIIVAVIASQSGDKSSRIANTGLPTPTATVTTTPTTTPLSTSSTSGTFYFSDNFDNGIANNWHLDNGWSVVSDNGNYVLDGQFNTGTNRAWPSINNIEDYQLEADFMLISGSLAIVVRVSNTNTTVNDFISICEDHVNVCRGMYTMPPTVISSADNMHLGLSQWHSVRIVLNGANIKVYIDQDLVIDCQDPAPTHSGAMFLLPTIDKGNSGYVRVDNIVIQPN